MNLFLRLQLSVSKWLQLRKLRRDALRTKQWLKDELEVIQTLSNSEQVKLGTLIVKCDDIGDFLFWQQCIPYIKANAPKPITFVGNAQVKPLVEAWFDFADHYIWINKSQWGNAQYRLEQYQTLSKHAYELVFTPLFTRQYKLDDLLVAAAQSDRKIAWSSRHHSYIPNLPEAEAIMHSTIHSDQAIKLEYFRNLEFIEKLFQAPVEYTVQSPFAQFKKHNHLIIFPIASSKARNWPVHKFAQVIQRMQGHFTKIIVLGGPNAVAFSEALKPLCKTAQYIDLCAQTSLLDLMTFIGEASVLLTPDSAALHYGILTATNTVVISNATNWQRFTNYQPYVKHQVKVVYPEWLQLNPDELKLQYSHTEIKSISVDQICEAILSVKAQA